MNEQAIARALYKKLLACYPRVIREQLGESMQQTFDDLYTERKRRSERGLSGYVLWIFVETGVGIIKEHILLMAQGIGMKNIISNPTPAAITSFILSLPLGFLFVIFNFDIEPLIAPLKSMLTVNGYDVNVLGRIVLVGGLLLLPVAFVINLLPMLKKEGHEQKRRLHAVNLIAGAAILLLITSSWRGLIVEEIYCLRGIRCD